MADKIVLERTYNVPLRKGYLNSPKWRRTERAVTEMKKFLIRHMKSENIKLGKALNEKMWLHGIRNPPHHVKITVTKDEKGLVKAELFAIEKKTEKKAEKKKAPEKKPAKKEVKK